MIKTTTITFGTSSHYFKTSVQVTLDSNDDFDKALKIAKKQYLKALAQELRLSKKFDQMSLEEIEDYIKERIKNE
jgi:ribosomal protein S21